MDQVLIDRACGLHLLLKHVSDANVNSPFKLHVS